LADLTARPPVCSVAARIAPPAPEGGVMVSVTGERL